MAKIYPRLESFEYEEKISSVEDSIKSENGRFFFHPNDAELSWLPMGNRVDLSDIGKLRDAIMSFKSSEGLKPDSSAQKRTEFDRKLGLKLLDWMDITPSIAADNGMWAYLNIMVIPDLIRLRWGYTEKGEEQKINHERYYDTNRSYLKKLWFTAYMIHDADLYTKMLQDEIDTWYDRAFTRGMDAYVNSIYDSFHKNVKLYKLDSLGDLYREFFKAINRKLAFINYYALGKKDLECLHDECFRSAYVSLNGKELPELSYHKEESLSSENSPKRV